ncbi:cytochrome P450 [Mycobacterium sp. URHB0044]|uniref:cytochrome P450 n=1 Tax=Mycobacterium sp. URHB0044 TaxID=1380386 RepID=UPI00048EBDEF|nr:cytochrome P450 [Mycobacterium sp. URHB0044]
MTTSAAPFDSRLAPIFTEVKGDGEPQHFWHRKANDVRMERLDGIVHLYRYTDILTVNRHPAVLGQGGRGSILGSNSALIPLELDGPGHVKYRKLLDPLFAPKRVALLEASFRALARELIDSFSHEKTVDLYDRFCVPLPCLTFLRLLGAPTEDLTFFLEFKDAVIHAKGDTAEEKTASAAVAGAKLYEYLNALIDARREHPPRDDLLGALMQGTVDGEPVSQLELLNMLFLLMFAGLDTVTASMSCIFAWLARHPEQRDRLVRNPEAIRAAVEELLRYESPVPAGTRYATEDIDLGGEVIHAGEAIHAIWSAANVDPTATESPMDVKFDRPRNVHMVFASGTHRCLGSHLARLELRLAIEELHRRFPRYGITRDDEPRYDNIAVRMVEYLPITLDVG